MNRRAFTLVELLIVIGVLAILMGILVWGTRGFGNRGLEKSTRQRMEALKSMQEELRRANNLKDISLIYNSGAPINSPAVVMPGYDSRYPNAAGHVTVVATQQVYRLLRAIPTNKTTFENLPSNYFLEPKPPTKVLWDPPMLLDAWGNPMIFVPREGINVTTVILSNNTPPKTVNIVRTSPDGRPFWASAGPDGNFDTDQDNVYSFEN